MAMDDPLVWLAGQPPTDNPVRQRVLQALAGRAAAQPPGALREQLVARLVQRALAQPAVLYAPPHFMRAPSPLADLLASLQPGAELRTVQAHHRTWTALRVARRLADVAAPLPDHLGPLNGQTLMRRTLQQLQALSPDYVQRFITQLDTLAALAPLAAIDAVDAKPANRKSSTRRR